MTPWTVTKLIWLNQSALNSKYIYDDYVSGNIWALTFNGKSAVKNELIANLPGDLSSFGEDSKSNPDVLYYVTGKLFRIAAN